MSDLVIRAATDDDVEGVLEFWQDAAEGTSISDDASGVAALIARDPEALLLAERGGKLAGTVIAGWGHPRTESGGGWRCHLYRLAVCRRQRRQGVATALLEAAEKRFSALGGRRSDAMVLDRNASGRSAWTAAGYAPEPQWSRWVKHLA
jgi:ribosomal protein S18 acetylase RimI-like enzyme